MVDVGDNIVQNHDDEVEVPGEALQLLGVFLDVLGPLDVVDLPVWLDEVLADGLNVVNHDQLDLVIFDSRSQVDEDFGVLVDVVHM